MVERLVPDEPAWAEFSAAHLARYLFAAPYAPCQRVLDAGCGSGYGSRLLREAGATAVVGFDAHAETIKKAEQQFGGDGVDFLVDDCETLSRVAGSFGLVCSFETIEHLRQPEAFLAAVVHVLADTGTMLISTPDRAWTPPFGKGRPRNPFHVFEWYRDEFRALLERYFDDVDMRVQVESAGLLRRVAAVEQLEDLLARWRLRSARRTIAKNLAGLAAPSIGDYPIVSEATAALFGAPAFHVAICRGPRRSSS